MRERKTITFDAMTALKSGTHSLKDNSPRGYKTVSEDDVKVGDLIILDNHFTLVTE